MNYPIGAIGADNDKRNYIKYLIDRYNEFSIWGKEKSNYSYAVIYNIIKKKYRASCFYIPITKFEELSLFLQLRICNTKLGRINSGKAMKLYSTFDEYVSK